LQGAFEANWHWAAWAVSGIVLGAAYLLWLYQRTMFGACDNPKNQVLKDLNFREIMTLVPLILWAFWIGLYPKPYFKVLDEPVKAIVQSVNPDFYKGVPVSAAVPKLQQSGARIQSADIKIQNSKFKSAGPYFKARDQEHKIQRSEFQKHASGAAR
jgi:hypothetical protein